MVLLVVMVLMKNMYLKTLLKRIIRYLVLQFNNCVFVEIIGLYLCNNVYQFNFFK